MGTYTAKTRSIGHRPRSKRLRELGGTVVRQIVGGEGGTADLTGYELVSNKVAAVTAESTDEQYPTAKLLFDLYTAIGLTLQALQNDKANTAYVDTQLNSLTGSIASIAGALQGKADANHQHTVSDVTNLQQALNYKSDVQHTHPITDLTNAAALFTQFALSSGVVSLTIGGQQRSITLPTAATPSGDPMHYVYEKLGCSYNAQTGLWTYRDLDDLTTEQVNNAYVFTGDTRNIKDKSGIGRDNTIAVRFCFASDVNPIINTNGRTPTFNWCYNNNRTIEYAYFAPSGVRQSVLGCNFFLSNCAKLKGVGNVVYLYDTNIYVENNNNAFNRCPELVNLKIQNFRTRAQEKFFLHYNAALSLDSIVYLIVNAANGSASTVYLHADAMSRCTADTAEYTYQGNTYTGIVALAAARGITLTDVLPS